MVFICGVFVSCSDGKNPESYSILLPEGAQEIFDKYGIIFPIKGQDCHVQHVFDMGDYALIIGPSNNNINIWKFDNSGKLKYTYVSSPPTGFENPAINKILLDSKYGIFFGGNLLLLDIHSYNSGQTDKRLKIIDINKGIEVASIKTESSVLYPFEAFYRNGTLVQHIVDTDEEGYDIKIYFISPNGEIAWQRSAIADEKEKGLGMYGNFVCLDKERILFINGLMTIKAMNLKTREVLYESSLKKDMPENWNKESYSYREDALSVVGNNIVYTLKEYKRVVKDPVSGSTEDQETGRVFSYYFNIKTYALEKIESK